MLSESYCDPFEAPYSPAIAGQGIFRLTAVLRSDCKEIYHYKIRSLTLWQAARNALAIAVPRPFSSKIPSKKD